MSEPKWMSFAKASPDREYLALMSYLPLKKVRMIPRFISYTREIQTQLSQAKGLIGYSLRAKPLRRAFWTLSVWEDENALMEFVSNPPHHHVMTAPVGLNELFLAIWLIVKGFNSSEIVSPSTSKV